MDTSPRSATNALIDLYKAVLLYTIVYACRICNNMESLVSSCQLDKYATDIQLCQKRLESSLDSQGIGTRVLQLFEITNDSHDISISSAEDSPAKKVSLEDDESPTVDETELHGLIGELLGESASTFTKLDRHPASHAQTNIGTMFQSLYDWISSTPQYHEFLNWDTGRCRVLWLHGGPGSGTSTVLEAAVRSLYWPDGDPTNSCSPKVAYFLHGKDFLRQDSALSILKHLISHILRNQPSLHHHLRSKFNDTKRASFGHPNDFYGISTVFFDMIQDANFLRAYFVVDSLEPFPARQSVSGDSGSIMSGSRPDDSLDEHGLKDLLNLISTSLELSGRVKWLLSVEESMYDAGINFFKGDLERHLTICNKG